MRIVFVSTSVGAIGSGIGGGVELTLRTLADGLVTLGHEVTVVAPRGSRLEGHRVIEVDGTLHVPSQTIERSAPLEVPTDSVLTRMWDEAMRMAGAGSCDVVLNFAYDVLPFERAESSPVPVAHLVSMGSLSDEMDKAVIGAIRSRSVSVAMHTQAQAESFGSDVAARATIVASGIDLEKYHFIAQPGDDLAFVGRISPEKGIDDVFAVAEQSGRRVLAFGVMEDALAWQDASSRHQGARVEHQGFLPTRELQERLGRCAALIMVHRWVEAFGNVAIEALACGVPVITYDRGGPAEIVRDGVTGYVVRADDPAAVCDAVSRLGTIDRRACRSDAETRFSAVSFVRRVEQWLGRVVGAAAS